MKSHWEYLPESKDLGANLAESVLLARGHKPAEFDYFINPNYETGLNDPLLLSGIKPAIKRIMLAKENKQNVVIYGDYDIDGITASALLADFFDQIGINISTYIPDRFSEGYGINKAALKQLKDNGADLVITVDCGVNSVAEAKYAKQIGLDLIITDHHDPLGTAPKDAIAVINPKLPGQKYPFKELAGVGVAFALVRGLIQKNPNIVPAGSEKWLLDLVALGTICDVVPLIGENRILAYFGLLVAKKGRRPGFRALAKASGTDLTKLRESDFGFRFGPRLNAAGRIDHAKVGLETMMAKDETVAAQSAQKLQVLNSERQDHTAEIYAGASKQAKQYKQDCILVLSDPGWSHGTVGIVASKISERYRKPTIILQELGETSKGSARSVGKFSIIDAISSAGEHLTRFGGHQFAAGLTLPTENIAGFRNAINQYGMKNIDVIDMLKTYIIDLTLNPSDISLESARQIESLAPFGNQHSQPLFANQFTLHSMRPIGKDLSHLKIQLASENNEIFSAIAFSKVKDWADLKVGSNYEFAYYLSQNEWQGVVELQLELVDVKVTSKI
jgi:single-stranded-DNA-specific exonuclease